MRHSSYLLLVVMVALVIQSCAVERPNWHSDRGSIGGAIRDPLTHELID